MNDTENRLPLVSVGMPLFNAGKTLNLALDSLINQSFQDFEIIISDNYSSDNTEEICNRYLKENSNIRYFRQDENIGPVKNFQFVLSQAKGRFFMWAAHDDFWDKDYLSKCIEVFNENTDCVTVFCNLRVIDVNNNELLQKLTFSSIASDSKFRRMIQYFLQVNSNLIYGLHRIEIIREITLEPIDWMDVYVVSELAVRGKIFIVPSFLFSSGTNHPHKPYSMTGKYLDFKIFRLRISKMLKDNYSFVHRFFLLLLIFTISFKAQRNFKKIIDNWPTH